MVQSRVVVQATRARWALVPAVCLGVVVPAGCGGSGSGSSHTSGSSSAHAGGLPPARQATLILDFVPNAVHAGIYRALAAGYYRREGIDLRVVTPSATTDTLKLIDAHSAQFGLADGSDVAGLIAAGGDAQAVMAIVQRPLGGLIALAAEHLRSPADLQGRTVGIAGVPSDTAVLDTEVRHAGGDPAKVHVVTVGFNGPQALVAGRMRGVHRVPPRRRLTLRASAESDHGVRAGPQRRAGIPGPGRVHHTRADRIRSRARARLRRGDRAGCEDALAVPQRRWPRCWPPSRRCRRRPTHASLETTCRCRRARRAARISPRECAARAAASGVVPFGTLPAGQDRRDVRWMVATEA